MNLISHTLKNLHSLHFVPRLGRGVGESPVNASGTLRELGTVRWPVAHRADVIEWIVQVPVQRNGGDLDALFGALDKLGAAHDDDWTAIAFERRR